MVPREAQPLDPLVAREAQPLEAPAACSAQHHATLGAVAGGAASGAGVTQALGQPALAAVTPPPEFKEIRVPSLNPTRLWGCKGLGEDDTSDVGYA